MSRAMLLNIQNISAYKRFPSYDENEKLAEWRAEEMLFIQSSAIRIWMENEHS